MTQTHTNINMEQQQPSHHCPHHHHHHVVFHHPHHHHHHVMIIPKCNSLNSFPQNPDSNFCTHLPQFSKPSLPHFNPNLGSSHFHSTQNLQDDGVVEYEEEDEEEEDPVFVMTDEWKEFFAKSEAKRQEARELAKKQKKKNKKSKKKK